MDNKQLIIILIGIFLLAIAARSYIVQYDGLFEYDAYFHARMTADIVQQGHVNNPDVLAYYQLGGAPQTVTSAFWLLSAGLYNVLFGWNIGYDFEVFTKFMQVLPILFGALISIMFFFVGRNVFKSDTIGVIMAFVGAITPAFVYRTMAGAQGDNAFGFLPFILGIYFLIKASQIKELTGAELKKYAGFLVGSVLCFVFMVFAWNMYVIAPIILIWYAIYLLWTSESNKINWLHIAAVWIVSIAIILTGFFKGENVLFTIADFSGVGATTLYIAIALATIGGIIVQFLKLKDNVRKVMPYLIIGVMLVALVFVINTKSDFVDRTTLGSMVGEEAIGHDYFEGKYNVFIFIAPLALLLAMFIATKNKQAPLLFMIVFLTFFMAWYKLKFTFSLGFAMAFAFGIILYALKLLYDEHFASHKTEFKWTAPILLLILVSGVAASGIFIQDYSPVIDNDPAFKEMIAFLKTTPADTKVFNDWGVGHIITYEAERKASADNRNYSELANIQYAEFINGDVNLAYKVAHNDVNADLVLISLDDFYSFRSNEFYINKKVDGKFGIEFTKPVIQVIGCSPVGDTMSCNGNQIPKAQFDAWRGTKWHSVPDDFYNGTYPLYLYVYQDSVIYLNAAANNTNLAKLMFKSPETLDKYETAFVNDKYTLFKVK